MTGDELEMVKYGRSWVALESLSKHARLALATWLSLELVFLLSVAGIRLAIRLGIGLAKVILTVVLVVIFLLLLVIVAEAVRIKRRILSVS